ncbi:MAG TPA: [Fe-Fe] hydrogenase large subunit C-terminal domain-containing protein [Tenuifilaceae bacterium]|jgi:Na+-translocating ferredoxin:NAD+ oxidoreductase RNF subunit RnfB|nr:[Fe-Fe] hydrogenase large subunit C-terminal domain-containing protein [Bacteroidales bacterium]MDI9516370.1 [Fe-Fe] hydrogenase large subunit C-terminal domain-containing protein [Bacteroidota bacterium]NLH57469.1 4Fe-4S binding protein [Rikenellaceae bacterium]OQC62907.1 MAG: Iron hydrogenase 1 [Bacteroidetes bacterium ADurb.Bin008]HNV82232.1 [Fe-Fe] hydrogenase large subunit C-terminal domain-containing protein [Tenuifilaceae bacterium]
MSQLFSISEEKCINCFACVRVCPVKAIEVKAEKNFAVIVPNRCIGCGSCLTVCPVNAVSYRSSKEEVKQILKSGSKVAAICAPSISGEFVDITDYRKFVQMIKALGFTYVCEVTFGIDLVAKEYKKLFDDFKGKYFISTVCPVIVSLIEKFHPELVNNLAPIVSPMIATAKVIHKEYGEDTKVVYIGPCIQNKDEAKLYNGDGTVDSVLTFMELRELFDEFDIKESKLEYSEFDDPIGFKGSLLPIANGLLQAEGIDEDLLTGKVITTEGRNNVLDAVRQFEGNAEVIKRHFNLFYCEGCLMGPGTSRGGKKFIRRTMVVNYANKRLKTFEREKWEGLIEKHSDHDFNCIFSLNDQRIPTPPEEKITEVLKVIEKGTMAKDSGCEACGYSSCRDFAIAVSLGFAHTDMCLNYTLKNRQEYIKTLRATNDRLAKMQEALKESEKIARTEQEAARDASETITTMMKKLPSALVIIDKKLKIVQSNQSFIDLLGDDAIEVNEIIPGLVGADLRTLLPYNIYNLFSYVLQSNEDIKNRDIHYKDNLLNLSVFTIKKNSIVGAVIRDMYAPEVRKEEVIKRITDVIDINLAMVQKIGFLLGEGASETEQMLNSIIQTYREGDKKE